MELNEVGEVKELSNLRAKPRVKVIMCIKAPRGIMQIFENEYGYADSQCEAIKAFMGEHQND